MKHIFIVPVVLFLAIATPSCFGLVVLEGVSKQRAKELGATITAKMVGTNQAGVWLEFVPKGKLKAFSSVTLEITSGERSVVTASLSPLKQTPESVVVYFSTDPAYLRTSTLFVYYKSTGFPPYDGFEFKVGDFITQESLR